MGVLCGRSVRGYVGGCCVAVIIGDYVRGFSVWFVSWGLV